MRKLFLVIISFLVIFSTGCQITNKPPGNEAAPPTKQIKQTQRVPQTIPEPKRDQSPEAVAHRLASLAIRVPQVNDATAIVFGKYAIVGLDLNAHLDRSRVGTIKYSVAEALKEDPQGATALITSDPDLVQRIREMNADIKNGHPIKGIAEELSDIAARIIPQVPRSVQKKEQPPSKQDQQKLNQTNDPKTPRKDLYQK
ncbi:YhcN/YlaJ family sporulation lipoprotein [Tepidibacillus marianensis]|uniref:YhcN/YlaJ family sporulation lipoprotein n=1 Tax=Tepidibacillus marianensis TaxID=3131995 RepID=UPI0030D486A5